VEPERPKKLAHLIRSLGQMPTGQLRRKGLNGRHFALKNYLRTHLAGKLEDAFLKTVPQGIAT